MADVWIAHGLKLARCGIILFESVVKSKSHHRTGHEVPEVEYRCSFTLSWTSALDGEWEPVAIAQEAGWAPGKHSNVKVLNMLCVLCVCVCVCVQ
jgi:hypothetical protein